MGNNYNVSMQVENNVFYVRPFSDELKRDLDRLVMDANKVSDSVTITENDGTYTIATTAEITKAYFIESFWGMLYRRFLAESKRVCIDPVSEERYYVLIFSQEFITPCERLLVA